MAKEYLVYEVYKGEVVGLFESLFFLQYYGGELCWNKLCIGVSLVAQIVKNLPAIQETWVQSLGWEDPLDKEMATHSSILAWRIPWTEGPDGL